MLGNFKDISSILPPFGLFRGHLVYFMAIWYILWPFGTFCGHFGIFFPFGILYQEQSGNPALIRRRSLAQGLSPKVE
jgi:hypothetical protein